MPTIQVTLSWNKTLSGLLAAFYVVVGFLAAGAQGAFQALLFVILPLACIWFAETMGRYTGPTAHMSITQPSPPLFVCIAAWLLLLLPLVVLILEIV